MKLLLPFLLAILGLAVGAGAGVALKPKAEEAPLACPEGEACAAPAEVCAGDACPDAAIHEPPAEGQARLREDAAVVALEKPFVVPVFDGEDVVAMVIASIAVEIAEKQAPEVETAQPRLRDVFLNAMFLHANSGGFDGAFTTGQKMADLRAALLVAAREVFPGPVVSQVLITEIAKQEM